MYTFRVYVYRRRPVTGNAVKKSMRPFSLSPLGLFFERISTNLTVTNLGAN